MRNEIRDDRVIIYPEGRIDSNNASQYSEEFTKVVEENPGKKLEINMENIEYVSSAGLRIFLKLKKMDCGLEVTEVRPSVYEVFEMTDFTDIIDIKKALRRISVDGCEVIGQGFYGTVYRIDEDTIVKAYNTSDCIPMIENEQRRAKQAFKAGIPTAISYDLVRVGDSYGSVFEMLRAKTLNDLIKDDPGCADDIIAKYVDFMKLVHGTTMEPGSLPYARDNFTEYVDVVREYLTDDICEKLKKYLEVFPIDEHVVHGDIQMKNVMMADGELMLIDMDTLTAGHAIFDLAGIYATYCLFEEDEPGNIERFLGLPTEMGKRIWNGTFAGYFSDRSDEERAAIEDKIRIAANLRYLYLVAISDMKNGELGATRIRNAKRRLEELTSKVDSIYFDLG